MPDSRRNHPLMPSVLDRLTHSKRPSEDDFERRRAALIRQKKEQLQRDLQNLLNTRWLCVEVPDEFDELATSLVRYGIPDFTGANAASVRNREDFLDLIRESIERFEPRLRNVHLELMDPGDEPVSRELRFYIYAVFVTDVDSEEVEFISTMEPASGTFSVKGG